MAAADRPRVVVMGASAGGVEALGSVIGALPADLPAAVLAVLHIGSTSFLPDILARRTQMPTASAVDGEPLEAGRVYVAPPGRHLVVADGHVHLSVGPRENRHRPAVDPLFRSAAQHYGRGVIGVVLSGSLDDGTAGLRRIKARGGLAIVQDPEDAVYSGMPASAVANVEVDEVLPLAEIAASIVRHANSSPSSAGEEPADMPNTEGAAEPPVPTPPDPGSAQYACPECGGVLQETDDDGLVRFRCHTGHMYSPESLLAAHSGVLEGAMWSAVRALDERAALLRRVGIRLGPSRPYSQSAYEEQAVEAEAKAQTIRLAVEQMRLPADDTVEA